ncbi:hypothetical protein LZZ90_03415 [Flavobacterium sp. SM15]|uniref:hypothetical protein n=1 Tax=Flavobacterium sp. SM15 TaxID=2908005 RepID=UPI001EDAD7CB|nr:hypothetical protein [Flavobacterium sp. SM15]MCG2610553.1 hypothetical protein [Flavobacterium sp. SM15]
MLKKVLFLFFVAATGFAQGKLQIVLNQPNYVYDVPQNGAMTNNLGLDQILSNYSATALPIYDFGSDNMGLVQCAPENLVNLKNELSIYVTVVRKVCEEQQVFVSSDKLMISLVNANDGVYVSTIDGIVHTNNAQLNAVFQDYEIDYYQDNYIRTRACEVNALKQALQGLTSVIEQV